MQLLKVNFWTTNVTKLQSCLKTVNVFVILFAATSGAEMAHFTFFF